MRRALSFAVALASALVLVSVAAGGSGGGATFTDPTEGTPGSADIQSVSVTNNPSSRTATFAVQLSNMPEFTDDNAALELHIDADNDPATGGGGFDCVIGLVNEGWYVLQWDGNAFTQVKDLALYVTYKDGLFTSVVPAGACNLSPTFAFQVASYRGPDAANPVEDDAPDTGTYDYTLSTAAPTVKTLAFAVTSPPRSGQEFMVTFFDVAFTDGTYAALRGMTCTAKLAGRKLPGTATGGCAFSVPKKSHGKKLVVSVAGKAASGITYLKRTTYVVR